MPDPEVPAPGSEIPPTPPAPVEEFDKDRAMATIQNLRQFEKQAKEQARLIADMESRLKAIDDAKLSETEKATKTAEEANERATTLETQLRTERAQLAIEREARKLNIVDSEVAATIIASKLQYDADGKPSNVTELLTELAKSKPYLVTQAPPPGVGASVTNPARGATSQGTFTAAQIADRAFWEANKNAIIVAMREGRITD